MTFPAENVPPLGAGTGGLLGHDHPDTRPAGPAGSEVPEEDPADQAVDEDALAAFAAGDPPGDPDPSRSEDRT